MLLSSSKLYCTAVKVCIVEYLLIAWQVNGRTWVQSIVPFEHNFALENHMAMRIFQDIHIRWLVGLRNLYNYQDGMV